MAKWHAKITHCPQGHRYTKTNTYVNSNNGSRKCRTCTKANGSTETYKRRKHDRVQEKQVWINNYLKEHPCVDCGEVDPVVLVFDHCRGKKKREVTSMCLMSIPSILEEIKKCDVVCANDHARRTARRAKTLRWRLNTKEIAMTKLTALSKLASAYWYLANIPGYSAVMDGSAFIVYDKFNYIRRSLTLQDLAPTPKCTEGFNGRMPTQL